MTSPADPQPPRRQGALDALTDLGLRLVTVLPPAFLMLLVINVLFLGIVLWWLDDQLDARIRLLERIIDHCLH